MIFIINGQEVDMLGSHVYETAFSTLLLSVLPGANVDQGREPDMEVRDERGVLLDKARTPKAYGLVPGSKVYVSLAIGGGGSGPESKRHNISKLLVRAVRSCLPDLGEQFEHINYDDPNPAISAVTTLTRLKMLEIIALRAIGKVLEQSPDQLRQISDDIGKNVVVQLVAAKTMPPAEAKLLFKHYAIDDVIEKAAAGPAPDYGKALHDLEAGLERGRALRED